MKTLYVSKSLISSTKISIAFATRLAAHFADGMTFLVCRKDQLENFFKDPLNSTAIDLETTLMIMDDVFASESRANITTGKRSGTSMRPMWKSLNKLTSKNLKG